MYYHACELYEIRKGAGEFDDWEDELKKEPVDNGEIIKPIYPTPAPIPLPLPDDEGESNER